MAGQLVLHSISSIIDHLVSLSLKGLLLGYITVGTICWSVMVHSTPAFSQKVPLLITSQVSLGEMVAYLPIPGGHIKLGRAFR